MPEPRPWHFLIRCDRCPEDEDAAQVVGGPTEAVLLLRPDYPACCIHSPARWLRLTGELPPPPVIDLLARVGVLPDDWFDYDACPLWSSPQRVGTRDGLVGYVYRRRGPS